jgi:predicted transcriptional regulator
VTDTDRVQSVIDSLPDDAPYDEIVRELAFEWMVEHGLADSREGRVISNEEMGRRIRTWSNGQE